MIRVAVVYTVVAWAAVEAASVIFPALLLPEWTERLVVALALLGFPVALALAWAFEVRPERAHTEPQAVAPEPLGEERLDGWKRIAAYLNRDVRTVRRWEKDRGLPVRRLMHDKLATVYAYRSELDQWMTQRDTAAPEKSTARHQLPGKPGPRWVWVALPVLVMGMVLAWLRPGQEEAPIRFGEWDWVLITEFDNRTGEDVLDGTAEYALQRELSNSHHLKVVPRERIKDALRLMKLPEQTIIDLETGREISLRDGEIRMLITGRVEKLGNAYLVSTELVNPSDGVTLASFSRHADGQDQILPGISDLAIEVRTALGESLASIEESEAMLEKVTTPSLAALRLFSDANEAMSGNDRVHALAILEEAVRIDPDFASAHLLLYYAYGDRDETPRAEIHLRRAVELAEQASERERLFILATYYGFLRDQPKAIDTYHLLLRLYPDHYWANGNLSNVYESEGRFREALPFRRRVAELRPNSVGWYPDLDIVQLAIAVGDQETRDFYLNKLSPYVSRAEFAWLSPFLMLAPVHQAWIDGDYAGALAGVEELVAREDSEALVADGWRFAHIRSVYLALGKLERFRELTAKQPQLGWFEALLDYDSGNPETLEQYVESARGEYWDAVLMAMAGQIEGARSLLEDPEAAQRVAFPLARFAWQDFVRGQIALSEGRLEDAVELLDQDAPFLNISYKWAHLFAMHSLARAYEKLGSRDKAIETLDRVRRQKPLSVFETAGTYMWQRNQVYLRELYLRAGQTAAAAEAERELTDVLRLADPDHPFLLALERVPAPG